MQPDNSARRGRNHRKSRGRSRTRPAPGPTEPGDPFAPRPAPVSDPFAPPDDHEHAYFGSAGAPNLPAFPAKGPAAFGSSHPSQPAPFGSSHPSQPAPFGSSQLSQPAPFGSSQPIAFGSAPANPAFPSSTEQSAFPAPGFGAPSSQPTAFGAPASQQTAFGAPAPQLTGFGSSRAAQIPFGSQPSAFDAPPAKPPAFGGQSSKPTAFGSSSSQPNPFQSSSRAPGYSSAPRPAFGNAGPAPGAFAPATRHIADGDPFVPRTHREPSAPSGGGGSRPMLSTKIMITKVPQWMFSREGVLAHFRKLRDVNPLDVTIRGSARAKDGRRTAVISFATPEEATLAMKRARFYSDNQLQLVYFKEGHHSNGQPPSQPDAEAMESQYAPRAPQPTPPTPMSNELLFAYVPEELFTEDAVRDLFNSISGNQVAGVSIRSRPYRGSVKRTAIIRFPDISVAKTALEMLPSYKGQQLQVTYRIKRPHLISNQSRLAPSSGLARTSSESMSVSLEPTGPSTMYGATMETFREENVAVKRGSIRMNSKPEASDAKPWGQPSNDDDTSMQVANTLGAGNQSEWNSDTVGKVSRDPRDAQGAEVKRLRQQIADLERQKARKNHGTRSVVRGSETTRNVQVRTGGENINSNSRQKSGARRTTAHASKQVVREDTNNGGAWRNLGGKVDLENAVQFVGTCQTMCPEKEISERIVQRDISIFETVDGQGGDPDPSKAVKKYRRSAALGELPQPEEVRTAPVLLRTMEYLKSICDGTDWEFVDIHNFVRDRTRSLRQDFTFQGIKDESCMKIQEESTRFHILSEYLLTGSDPAKFSSNQNREQLDKCLISLREIYDLRREQGLPTAPNEPEMQAYYILTRMSDPKTCVQLCTGFARDVRKSLPVQFALQVVKAGSKSFGNYFAYFACVRAAPYLMSCLMHSQFTRIRCQALAIFNFTHGNASSPDNLDVSSLTFQLGFEDDEETIDFCALLGIRVDTSAQGSSTIISTPSPEFDIDNGSKLVLRKSPILIGRKSNGLKLSEIIGGTGSAEYNLSLLPYVDSSDLKKLAAKEEEGTLESFRRNAPASPSEKESMREELREIANPSPKPPIRKPSILSRLGSTGDGELNAVTSNVQGCLSPPPNTHGLSSTRLINKSSNAPMFSAAEQAPKALIAAPATSLAGKGASLDSTLAGNPPIAVVQETQPVKKVTFDLGVSGQVHLAREQNKPANSGLNEKKLPEIAQQLSAVQKPLATDMIRSRRDVQGEKIQPLDEAQAIKQDRSAQGSVTPGELESIKRTQDAEAVQAAHEKELAKEAMLRHREELFAARQQAIEDRTTAEACMHFQRVFDRIAEMRQRLEGQVVRIQEQFKHLSVQTDGPPKVLESCEKAELALQQVAGELHGCMKEMENVAPMTAVTEEAQIILMDKLRSLEALGHTVWMQVWALKGLALVTPVVMSKRSPRVPAAREPKETMHPVQKRKASNRNGDIGIKRVRTLSLSQSGYVWKTAKVARKERTLVTGEIDEVVAAMLRNGLVRWQLAIVDGPEDQTIAERRLYTWVKRRLAGRTEVPRRHHDVLRICNTTGGSGITHASVKLVRMGQRIPATANVVMFCVDLLSAKGFEDHFTRVEKTLSKRKDDALLIGSLPPVAILLIETNRGQNTEESQLSAQNMIKKMTSLVSCGLITEYHIVDISVSCAEFLEKTERLSTALVATVEQSQEALKSKGLALQRRTIGEYLVQMGNSAWIRSVATGSRDESRRAWLNEIIAEVNAAWSAAERTVGEEQRRWPEEMASERNRLQELRLTLRRKLQLPSPGELDASTAKDYIAGLAKVAGVACPGLRFDGIRPLSQFCRALGHLMKPYVSSILLEDYSTEVYIPVISVPSSDRSFISKLGHSLANVGTTDLRAKAGVERTWDGTPLKKKGFSASNPDNSRCLAMGPGSEPALRRSEWDVRDRVGGRRRSLDMLSRTLDFSPMSQKRRKILPASTTDAAAMFLLYDEICKTEEAHKAVLDETYAMLLRDKNSSYV